MTEAKEHLYQLVAASQQDGKDIFEMLQDIGAGENGFNNGAFSVSFRQFPNYLKKLKNQATSRNLSVGRVPQTTYWFKRDGYPVGIIKLRHYLTDALRVQGGHIGYSIRPSERGKGLGTLMLKYVLREAKAKGILKALLTCYEDNLVSRRMIERNGGVLEKVENGNCYYWIGL